MPGTYKSEPLLTIDGKKATSDLLEDILQISVEESLYRPAMFTLTIANPYFPGNDEEKTWQHIKLFKIGTTVKIGFGSSTTDSDEFDDQEKGYVIEGEITSMETHFTTDSQAPIIVSGYDISHRLHRGRYNRAFQNMSDTDIFKKIIGEVGISTGTVDNSGGPHGYGDINGSSGYVFQENQTNMEFLRELAARNGFELFVEDGKINFRKPSTKTTLSLEWLTDLYSFRVRVNNTEQVSEVEVRGWDYSKKKAIVETVSSEKVKTETEYGKGSKTSTSFNGKPPKPKAIVTDRSVYVAKEAKAMAQALADELGGTFVAADGRADGNPDLRPGRLVKLSDMGKYSGKYYVTETHHLYCDRVYTTDFSVRGLRGGDLLTALAPSRPHLQPGQTLMVGIVTNNNDPEKWGRVRVKFPTLTEDHESYWARVVGTGAGPERGFDCLPEINDEVLVAFEHGDIHRPYVVGGVWNGKEKPPEQVTDSVADGKVRLRTFKTRTGHSLQFTEEDKGGSKKGIYLDSVYGHQVYLNDTDKYIELKTKDGHIVRLDDQNKKIEIKKGSSSITINTQSNKMTLKATTIDLDATTINLDATSLNLKAKGIVNVKGRLIKLN